MARKVGKKNKVSCDFAMYDYMLLGTGGLGKTTIVNQIGQSLYGETGVLLLEMGRENGVQHLDAFYEQVDSFDDLEEIIDVLIKERNTTFKDTRIICIDSVDELVRLAEAKTIEIYNDSVSVEKEVNTINACWGGFAKGQSFASDMIVNTIFKLKDVGYSLFFISHVKEKTLVDPITQVEYPQVTCSIAKNYFNSLKDKCHVVAVGYVEREYESLKSEDRRVKGFDGKTRNERVEISDGILDEKRVICFRDTNYVIDAKSRFANIKEKIDFDSNEFINAIMEAIKYQTSIQIKREVSDKELQEIAEQQYKEQTLKAEEMIKVQVEEEQKINEAEEREELLQTIMNRYKTLTKEQKNAIKQKLVDNGVSKLQELSTSELGVIVGCLI